MLGASTWAQESLLSFSISGQPVACSTNAMSRERGHAARCRGIRAVVKSPLFSPFEFLEHTRALLYPWIHSTLEVLPAQPSTYMNAIRRSIYILAPTPHHKPVSTRQGKGVNRSHILLPTTHSKPHQFICIGPTCPKS